MSLLRLSKRSTQLTLHVNLRSTRVSLSSFCSLLNVVQVFSLLLVPFSKRQFFEVNARVAGSMWKVMQVRSFYILDKTIYLFLPPFFLVVI